MATRSLLVELVLRAKNTATGVFDAFGRRLSSIRDLLLSFPALVSTAFAGLGIARFFSSATSSAASFEQQMARVAAVTNASAEDLAALQAAAEEAGARTKFTATEAGEGLENLARAGLSAREAIATLPDVLALASAEGLDLSESASFITQTLAQFNLGVDQSGRVIDVLVKTSQSANTNVREVGNAMSYAALLAKDAGLSIEETAALIGKLADNGLAGERAGTALRSMLSLLADPASKAREALAELGDTSGGLLEAINTIADAGPRGSKALLAFGTEAAPALRALVNTGKPALDALTTSLQNASGAAGQASDTMGNTLQGALTRLNSAWDALKRNLVEPLLGPLAADINQLSEGIGAFVQSGRLEQLRRSLLQTFQDSSTAAKTFFENFDFDKFIADLSNFVRETTQSFATLTSVVGAGANVLTIAFSGLKSVIAGTRIAVGQIKGDISTVDTAFQDLEQATHAARAAMQRLGLIGKDTQDVIGAISREAYDAAAAHERLNSTTYETAGTLHTIPPAANEAGSAVDDLGQKAGQAAGMLGNLGSNAKKTGDEVTRSIGNINAAFDGSLASSQAVSQQLETEREQRQQNAEQIQRSVQLTEQQADAQAEVTDATAGTHRAANILSQQLIDVEQRAQAAADAMANNSESSGAAIDRLNDAWQELQDNIRLVERLSARSLFGSSSDFADRVREIGQLRDRLLDVGRATDSLNDKIANGTVHTSDLTSAAALLRARMNDVGAEDLAPLRRALDTARDQVASFRAEINGLLDDLRQENLRLLGDDAALEEQQFREQLERIEQLAEVDAAAAREARRLATENHKLRLEQIKEQQRAEEERARAAAARESSILAKDVSAAQQYLASLDAVNERENQLSRNRVSRLQTEAQAVAGAASAVSAGLSGQGYNDDDIRKIDEGLRRLWGLRA